MRSGSMRWVTLNNIRFHAFIGLYEEEQQWGNDFLVNIKVGIRSDHFIDYADLHSIAMQEMNKRNSFMEKVVENMEAEIRRKWTDIDYLFISIQKLNPPMPGEIASSEVILEREYES